MKTCEYCGSLYTPNIHAVHTQKYCSQNCKGKAQFERNKKAGKKRKRKGGYNRTTYIICWLKAQYLDKDTAPCYYCGKRLKARGDWVLDHKNPLKELEDPDDQTNDENLVVCCKSCNIRKGSMPFEKYMKIMEKKFW